MRAESIWKSSRIIRNTITLHQAKHFFRGLTGLPRQRTQLIFPKADDDVEILFVDKVKQYTNIFSELADPLNPVML